MNKKNLKKIFFPLRTGRNRFFYRNGTVSSPLNPMFDMRSLIEPSHVHLNESFENAPYLSDCMELKKKLAITPSFKIYIILGQLLSYLRT